MSIKQRNGVWHCDFTTPDGKRIRQSLGTEDKREAQELHDKLKADSWRSAKLGDAPVKLFDEACIRWLREKSHKRSLDADKSKITFFLDHFHGWELSTITNDQIQVAISKAYNRKHRERWEEMRDRMKREGKPVPVYRAKPISESTKYSLQAFMRSLLRIAANEWGWLNSVPVVKARQPRNKRIRWLTHDEARNLIDCLPLHLKPVVTFALATGLRRSNILDLEWSQVDMQRKMAWIHPENAKGGKAIGVALNDTACGVLRGQIGKHNRWVFVHEISTTKPNGEKMPEIRKLRVDGNKAWNAALKRAGIENFRFHDLRHTWASWLVQSGVPLSALQEMGGWESIEMVRRYAHLSPNHLTQHARQIDSIFAKNGTNTAQGIIGGIKNTM
ncbi:site-specific integrase [Pectobacterium parmentieri]|nr:site-specific integrase [Pectobacterium parmentieri]MBI0520694.1 site-specific integrase [Pectobacterium parmentieri]